MLHTSIMAKILNTRFYDNYFQDLLEFETDFPNCSFIYDPIEKNWFNYLNFGEGKYQVIICTDFLTNADCHDRLKDYHDTLKNFPDKQLIIASPVYNAGHDYNIPNVHFICNGTDFMYQIDQYKELTAVEKTFEKDYHWSYISFIPRTHRLTVGCWLAGKNYKNGFIKVGFGVHNNPSWQNYYHFENSLTDEQVDILDNGWQQLSTVCHGDSIEGYNVPPNNNFSNFTLNLQSQYENLVVEIVGETTFRQHGVHVSEKYLHTVYGSVFPILIAPANTVEFLQDLGFDLYTDVVDHSYDRIDDPEQRIIQAIEDNSRLLNDRDYALECWFANKHRFQRNINFCKSNLESNCKKMFTSALDSVVNL